jgi:hypothetical protein
MVHRSILATGTTKKANAYQNGEKSDGQQRRMRQ